MVTWILTFTILVLTLLGQCLFSRFSCWSFPWLFHTPRYLALAPEAHTWVTLWRWQVYAADALFDSHSLDSWGPRRVTSVEILVVPQSQTCAPVLRGGTSVDPQQHQCLSQVASETWCSGDPEKGQTGSASSIGLPSTSLDEEPLKLAFSAKKPMTQGATFSAGARVLE